MDDFIVQAIAWFFIIMLFGITAVALVGAFAVLYSKIHHTDKEKHDGD